MQRIAWVFLAVCLWAAPARAAETVGSVASAFGTVWLQRGGSNYKLAQGQALQNGDAIITSNDAYAKLLMADESLLTVGAKSTFRIENFQSSATSRVASFRLFFGKVRAIVSKVAAQKNDYRFITPTAVAGVRGTHLVVQFDKATNKTTVSVIEGSVGFKPLDPKIGGEVMLADRQRSEQQGGSPPAAPTQMSDGDLTQLNQEIGKQTPGGDEPGEKPADVKTGEPGSSEQQPAGESAPEGEQGGADESRVDDNLNRVEQNLQQDQPAAEDYNPTVNPAAETGVRVRW